LLRVGLTGGVACGKTTVGEMLARSGAVLILADKIAHDLMRPGQPVYYEVVRHFGTEIVGVDGGIDRKKLADLVFGTGRIAELNQIVHPAVIAYQDSAMDKLAARDPDAIAVVEAALMLEAGAGKRFDKIVVVTCSREQKIARLAARQEIDRAAAEREVDRRMAAQWPDERKVALADYVIENSGSAEELEQKVDVLYRELKAASAKTKSPQINAEERR
jgi:dephospho-CoA kinase